VVFFFRKKYSQTCGSLIQKLLVSTHDTNITAGLDQNFDTNGFGQKVELLFIFLGVGWGGERACMTSNGQICYSLYLKESQTQKNYS
jgi:hypothetical protein